jgi:hypothetical protein
VRSIAFAALGVLVFGVAAVEGEALLARAIDGALEPLQTPTVACTPDGTRCVRIVWVEP